jgi:hypothetical protein
MRSIESSATPPSAAAPVSAVFRRTPSISTSVWLELVPRRNSEAWLPGPPVRANSTPACRPSSSISPGVCEDSIWRRVITVADGSESTSRCSVRVAVTSTSSNA